MSDIAVVRATAGSGGNPIGPSGYWTGPNEIVAGLKAGCSNIDDVTDNDIIWRFRRSALTQKSGVRIPKYGKVIGGHTEKCAQAAADIGKSSKRGKTKEVRPKWQSFWKTPLGTLTLQRLTSWHDCAAI
jgi:hypothetical protein